MLKYLESPSWDYPLRVAAALRSAGWPTPAPVSEPLVVPGGAWVLFDRLPGASRAGGDRPRERGRLLAALHLAAAASGIDSPRDGFPPPAEVVGDPVLASLLRGHARDHPSEGRVLLAGLEAAAGWFADHPDVDAPRSVIHGDFTPWNLLFSDDGRLTGVLDFEASHYTFQVADFALSWRGYQDEVLLGYDSVRPLSDLEWQLIRPAYQAWLFLGVRDALTAGPPANLDWQVAHLRKRSTLIGF